MGPSMELHQKIKFIPESYFTASDEVRKLVVNGCGAGGWKFDIVPDTIYGLNITEECNIHDWMYDQGSTAEDKAFADKVLLHNLLVKINDAFVLLRPLRRIRAYEYYEAVKLFGNSAFWANKEKSNVG